MTGTLTLPVVAADPELAQRLRRSAERLEHWKIERNRLIVEGYAEGVAFRELARLTGLSHPAVISIVRAAQLERDEEDTP